MKATWKQVWVTVPVSLLKVASGMFQGFPSVLLPALQAPGSDIPLDLHQASWFASTTMLVSIVGVVIGAYAMRRFGRRRTVLAGGLPALAGLVVIYFARDVTGLVVGRALHAVSEGSGILVGMVMLGELTSPRHRVVLLNLVTASTNVGSLLVHTLGHFVSWRTLAFCMAVPIVLSLVSAHYWPESPSWLAERHQFEKSREVFYWLRGKTEDTNREIERLIHSQQDKKIGGSVSENIRNFFKKFKMRNFWRPLLVVFVAMVVSECAGRHVFPAYAAGLVASLVPGAADPWLYGAAVDSVITLSAFTGTALLHHMRLRTLLLTSGLISTLSLFLASLFQYLLKLHVISQQYSYAPLIMFFAYFVFGNLGCTCIPMSLKGEIFPLEHRAVASMIIYLATRFTISVALKLIPHMIVAFGANGYFAITAGVMAVALLGLYLTLPETKHRTLQELDDYFTYGRFREELSRDEGVAERRRLQEG